MTLQRTQSISGALRLALAAAGSPLAGAALEPLADKGLAHDHVRLRGTGLLARIPKQSQLGLAAAANLAYQQACFERASAAGHAPRFNALMRPSEHLPRGALLVEEIVGRSATLPADLGAIVRALASIHSLAVPPPGRLDPLLHAADPLADLLHEVEQQAMHLDAAALAPPVRSAIEVELARLRGACAAEPRPPVHLIAFDGHPGNFIVRPDGEAVLVDLEKCRYAYPGLDLAHATLYTSTTWDLESHAILSLDDVVGAYRAWSQAMDPGVAAAAHPWQLPLRRAMWLWSITWCAKWRALSGVAAAATADGEDWSTQRSDAALVRHVRGRVDHYLGAPVVASVLQEFDALARAWQS